MPEPGPQQVQGTPFPLPSYHNVLFQLDGVQFCQSRLLKAAKSPSKEPGQGEQKTRRWKKGEES